MLDIRSLSPQFAVSPQIDPEDMGSIKVAGFTTVIDNRPDAEIPGSHRTEAMRKAAEAAGLRFVAIPIVPGGFTEDTVAATEAAISGSPGPVLAYCASGNRSSIAWALAQAGRMETDAILRATEAAGYNQGHLRPHLEAKAGR